MAINILKHSSDWLASNSDISLSRGFLKFTPVIGLNLLLYTCWIYLPLAVASLLLFLIFVLLFFDFFLSFFFLFISIMVYKVSTSKKHTFPV
jgi:hypothetical protein